MQRSPPRSASGIVMATTPMIRGGMTAHAVGSTAPARPVANRLMPIDSAPAAAQAAARRSA